MKQSPEEQTIQILQQKMKTDPLNPELFMELGILYIDSEETKLKGIEFLHHAVELFLYPPEQTPYRVDGEKAITVLKKIVAISPSDTKALRILSELGVGTEKPMDSDSLRSREEPAAVGLKREGSRLDASLKRILILSNPEAERQSWIDSLEQQGFKVQIVTSPSEAKRALSDFHPALILLDEFSNELPDVQLGDRPIIYLTRGSKTGPEGLNLPSSLNIEEYVESSIATKDLVQIIERCLYRLGKRAPKLRDEERDAGEARATDRVEHVAEADADRAAPPEETIEPPSIESPVSSEPPAGMFLSQTPGELESLKEEQMKQVLKGIESTRFKWEEAPPSAEWKLKYAEELGKNAALEQENARLAKSHLESQSTLWNLQIQIKKLEEDKGDLLKAVKNSEKEMAELRKKLDELTKENLVLYKEKDKAETEARKYEMRMMEGAKESAFLKSEMENIKRESHIQVESKKFLEEELHTNRKKLMEVESEHKKVREEFAEQSDQIAKLTDRIQELEREKQRMLNELEKLQTTLSERKSEQAESVPLTLGMEKSSKSKWGKILLYMVIIAVILLLVFLISKFSRANIAPEMVLKPLSSILGVVPSLEIFSRR